MLLSEITGFNKLSPAAQKAASMEAHEDHQEKFEALLGAIRVEMKLKGQAAEAVAEWLTGDNSGHGKDIAAQWAADNHLVLATGGDHDDEELLDYLEDLFHEELHALDI